MRSGQSSTKSKRRQSLRRKARKNPRNRGKTLTKTWLGYINFPIVATGSFGKSDGRPDFDDEEEKFQAKEDESFLELQIPNGPSISAKGQMVIAIVAATFIVAFACEKCLQLLLCVIKRLNTTPPPPVPQER